MSTYMIVFLVSLMSTGQPGMSTHDEVFGSLALCQAGIVHLQQGSAYIDTVAGPAEIRMASCIDVSAVAHKEPEIASPSGKQCIQLNGPFIES